MHCFTKQQLKNIKLKYSGEPNHNGGKAGNYIQFNKVKKRQKLSFQFVPKLQIFKSPSRWRRGSGLDCGSVRRPGFDSLLNLIACGPSEGKEVKDVFGRPGARVRVDSAR